MKVCFSGRWGRKSPFAGRVQVADLTTPTTVIVLVIIYYKTGLQLKRENCRKLSLIFRFIFYVLNIVTVTVDNNYSLVNCHCHMVL